MLIFLDILVVDEIQSLRDIVVKPFAFLTLGRKFNPRPQSFSKTLLSFPQYWLIPRKRWLHPDMTSRILSNNQPYPVLCKLSYFGIPAIDEGIEVENSTSGASFSDDPLSDEAIVNDKNAKESECKVRMLFSL